jgi:hypothetical protein
MAHLGLTLPRSEDLLRRDIWRLSNTLNPWL